jgi:hypothetical protein
LQQGAEKELVALDGIYLIAQKKKLIKLLEESKVNNPNANVSSLLIDGKSYGFAWIANTQVLVFVRKYPNKIVYTASTKIDDLLQKLPGLETTSETRASTEELDL